MLLAQTVGGAVACGSHGSSGVSGSLSDRVVCLRLVRANGEVLSLGPDGEGELEDGLVGGERLTLLRGARHSVGMLGVVTQLTLQCEPAYRVRRHVFHLPYQEFAVRCGAMLQEYRHLWVLWEIGQ
ncbi:MAG: hypothetical protein SGPRY_013552, partial [Prymnesium sp.]